MRQGDCDCLSKCKFECGPDNNYECCRPSPDHDGAYICIRCCNWFFLILPTLIIGLPCLIVGLAGFNNIVNLNIDINNSMTDTNNSIAYNNSLIALENNRTANENDRTTIYNAQIQIDYPRVQLSYNLTKSNYSYNVVQTKCNYTNETLSIPQCSFAGTNDLMIDYCQSAGVCINQTCDPCYYVCKTKECTIYEQQKLCVDKMKSDGCRVDYNFYTTYLCNNNPINNYAMCQSECVDFSCLDYDHTCSCQCFNNNTKICPVVKQYMVKTILYAYYKVNDLYYQIYNQTQICKIEDTQCLNLLVTISNSINYVYYSRTNPGKYFYDLQQLYQSYKPYKPYLQYIYNWKNYDQDQQNINLIIVGSIFVIFGLFMLLNEFLLMYPCCNCYTVLCQWMVHSRNQPKNPGKETTVVVTVNPLERKASELQCSICFTDLKTKVTKSLPCKHTFHTECIDTWTTTKPTCPLCRGSTIV
ncbi:MAG: E3 ubiquitin-protein ligase ATL41-like [Edafosvirus sp.]|uniref:E3 ubiquitin-protein ligase ATL41-like n=1 Tax=Edafosvirus sp. TaxID=2487765 RepID=A0A3G4ZU14_9VIRU|nr:MAG: E3 ubiquitin-protein ligase ATL41-like [Edafosvirus sp.]